MSHDNKKIKRLNRLYDRQILKFKTLDEDYNFCKEDELEGAQDLIFRIESFRKNLSAEKSEQLAKEFALPGSNIQPANQIDRLNDHDHNNATEDEGLKSQRQTESGWQKKLLREIVKKTHPDKVLNYSKPDQDFYSNICRSATAAYESGNYVKLMSLGADVRLKPEPVTEKDHITLIKSEIGSVASSVEAIKKSHGYIWYHLPEPEKEIFLINYMKQLGYVVEEKEVKDVIKRKRPTRQPGRRPENYLRKQRAKK